MQKESKLQRILGKRVKRMLDKQKIEQDKDFEKAHKAVQKELLKPEVMAVFQMLRDR